MNKYYPIIPILILVLIAGILLFVLDSEKPFNPKSPIAEPGAALQAPQNAGDSPLTLSAENPAAVSPSPLPEPGISQTQTAASRMVVGTVNNGDNKPLGGVSVTIVRLDSPGKSLTVEQVTKENGTFFFSLDPKQTYTALAEKDGFIPAQAIGRYEDPNPILIVKPLGKLIGRVEDERGKPVQLAKVSIRSASGSPSGLAMLDAQTKQDGTFETGEELKSGVYELTASQDGYFDLGKGTKKVQLQSPPEEIVLSLASKVFEVKGRVEEYGTGKGLPDMKVVLWAWGFGGVYNGQMGASVSDADGNFVFSNIPPGEYVVRGVGPESQDNAFRFSENACQVIVSLRDNSVDSVVLYAARTVEITGKVIDEKQSPVANANVMSIDPLSEAASTDESGRFKLNLPQVELGKPSRFRLAAEKPSESQTQYAVSDWLESRDGQSISDITLVLEGGVTLKGRILNRSAAPIADAALLLKNQYTEEIRETKSNGSGEYAFIHLMALPSLNSPHQFAYTLRTEAEDYASALHIVNGERSQGAIVHDVILDSALRIAGQVTDSSDRPLNGVHVYANQPGCPGSWQITDANGLYEFNGLTPGAYDLLFQYTQRPLLTGYLRNVRAGAESANIKLAFKPIPLNVRLTIPGGVNRAESFYAALLQKNADGSFSERQCLQLSISSSAFSIMLWEPGTYQLRCFVPHCQMASALVAADGAQQGDSIDIALDLTLSEKMNTLTGFVKQIEGFPVRFAQGPLGNQVLVGVDGRFVLPDIPDGWVDLVFWVCNNETGMPINVDVLIDKRVEGGGELDLGEIPMEQYFNPALFQ